MALLEARGLVKHYGRRTVVNGVQFEVNAGEVVGLLGPNGAGKTTSFRMTTGQITPNAGQTFFNGIDVTQLPMYQRARLGMGYLSQETSVFRKLTCEQNILAILEIMPRSRTLGRSLSRREHYDRMNTVLEQFGLTKVRKTPAARLSGGEKRRLEIARCLVCEPLLILLDEPFTGIDPITIAEIRTIVKDLRSSGIGVLLTDHNVHEALKITNRSYLIYEGKVLTHGTPAELLRDPVAIQRYIGEDFLNNNYEGTNIPASPTISAPSAPTAEPHRGPHRRPKTIADADSIKKSIEGLKTPDHSLAAADLIDAGPTAVPFLLTALERRDVELRHSVVGVLQAILKKQISFDPYAPEAIRKQQLAQLRDQHASSVS